MTMSDGSNHAKAVRRVAEARQIVAEQRLRIERLRARGGSTTGPENTLALFERTLKCLEDHEQMLRLQLPPPQIPETLSRLSQIRLSSSYVGFGAELAFSPLLMALAHSGTRLLGRGAPPATTVYGSGALPLETVKLEAASHAVPLTQ